MQIRIAIVILSYALISAQAIEPWKTLKLWPGKAPGETGDIGPEAPKQHRPGQKRVVRLGNVSVPTLSVFKPKQPNGAAVMVCPGGGYSILAWDLEGTEVAEWLNRELMVDGRGQGCDLPVAFNDPVGDWTVEATDLYTEKTTTTGDRGK